jgi:signal transduction histidine kinase
MFELTFYTVVINKLLNEKFNYLRQGKLLVVYSIIAASVGLIIEGWITTVILAAFLISMIFISYKKKIATTIHLYLISTVMMVFIQLLSLIPLKLLMGDVEYTFTTGVVALTICTVILVVMLRLVPLENIYYYVENKNKVFNVIIVNVFTISFLVVIYWNMDFSGVIENLLGVAVLILGLVVINGLVINNGLKNRAAISQLEANEKYLPIINELIDEIKSRQHDYHNHIHALQMMTATTDDIDILRAKLPKYVDEVSKDKNFEDFLRINNKIIAGFLYSKVKQIEAMGITTVIEIRNCNLSERLKDFEWIEIIGILIDNAVEASSDDGLIEIKLAREEEHSILIVKNRHVYIPQDKIAKFFRKGSSSKDGGRGYGLSNLKKIIDKNKGRIVCHNEQRESNYIVFKAYIKD